MRSLENKLTVEDLKENAAIRSSSFRPKLPSIRAKSSIRPSRIGEIFSKDVEGNLKILKLIKGDGNDQPKSRLGMMKAKNDLNKNNELTESKGI